MVKTEAPGKIIISGEYSVLYGCPALAMAVNLLTKVSICEEDGDCVCFDLANLNLVKTLSLESLAQLTRLIARDWTEGSKNHSSIAQAISGPEVLVIYTLIYLVNRWNLALNHGLRISVTSSIPIGCGMGSSAAVILSLIYALGRYFERTVKDEEYISLGKDIEQLQHGKSSGLDLFISHYGGCYFFEDSVSRCRSLPKVPLTLVNTGRRQRFMGEYIWKIDEVLNNQDVLGDFRTVTYAVDSAMQARNISSLKFAVKENHRLLNTLGVVSPKVNKFIDIIEARGGAAKISGAGALVGDECGIVLVVGELELEDLVSSCGYKILKI